jgi:hypothetical protein
MKLAAQCNHQAETHLTPEVHHQHDPKAPVKKKKKASVMLHNVYITGVRRRNGEAHFRKPEHNPWGAGHIHSMGSYCSGFMTAE